MDISGFDPAGDSDSSTGSGTGTGSAPASIANPDYSSDQNKGARANPNNHFSGEAPSSNPSTTSPGSSSTTNSPSSPSESKGGNGPSDGDGPDGGNPGTGNPDGTINGVDPNHAPPGWVPPNSGHPITYNVNGFNLSPGIYVGVHEVIGKRYHTSIIMIVDKNSRYYNHDGFMALGDTGAKYATIGAGPETILVGLPGRDKLISGVNRTKDVDLSTKVEYINVTATDNAIGRLMSLQTIFAKNNKKSGYMIEYDLFPSVSNDGYNSNSFTAGILNAAGFHNVSNPAHLVPGWSKPVPGIMFYAE